ncbi:MAG: cobalamin-dependent protein [Polyangiales bacterium]
MKGVKGDLGRHRIGAVAQLTGVSEHALRVWERRYAVVTPSRPHGGQRLYSDDEVARLRRLKHLTDLGHSIGGIARLPETEIDALIERHAEARVTPRLPGPKRSSWDSTESLGWVGSKASLVEAIRERFLTAIAGLDVESADRVLARAFVAFEPLALIDEVIAPLFVEIGDRWQRSKFSIAQEHAATAILRNQLGAVIRQLPPQPAAKVAICATPSGEHHEFGALFASVVCATRGWRVVYLGASLPADEIANAAKETRARAVMLSVVALPKVAVAREVSRLRTLLPRSIKLYLGGAGVDPKSKFVGAHYLKDLNALLKVLDGVKPR